MSATEIMPMIESLSHADKFKLMQSLLIQLAREEGISLQELKAGHINYIVHHIARLSRHDSERLERFISKLLLLDIPPQDQKFSQEENDSLWSIIGIAEGEDAAIARNHDQYLYGVKE